ncbi:MAG: hypothetical protein U1E50_04830 [Caulobacteraceae bacterium]
MPSAAYEETHEKPAERLARAGRTLKARARKVADDAMERVRDMRHPEPRQAAPPAPAKGANAAMIVAGVGIVLGLLIYPRTRALAIAAAPSLWKAFQGKAMLAA